MAGILGLDNYIFKTLSYTSDTFRDNFTDLVSQMPTKSIFSGIISAGRSYLVIGFKSSSNYAAFVYISYAIDGAVIQPFLNFYNGTYTWHV